MLSMLEAYWARETVDMTEYSPAELNALAVYLVLCIVC